MSTNVPRGTNSEPKPQAGSKRLGRGLAQLLAGPLAAPEPPTLEQPRTSVAVAAAPSPAVTISPASSAASAVEMSVAMAAGAPGLTELSVSKISPGKYQPRKQFDEASLVGLAESIGHSGVMQPIVVRPVGPDAFEIVAGERRWRAAASAGLKTIPAIVRKLSDLESAEWSVTENLQREDLNAMEKGWSLRSLLQTFALTQDQVAKRLGIDRSSVANLIRLTELEPEIAELIVTGKLTAGHGKALLMMKPGDERVRVARQAAEEQWSVRRTEVAAKRLGTQSTLDREKPAKSEEHLAVLADLERQLGQYLGTKVMIKSSGGGAKTRGSLQIDYYGLDHFDGLLRKMGFDRG
jgi:ParB family chromosome partitioning protein